MNQPSLTQVLCAGLEAQDWIKTASHSANWIRYAKWGRGAMYVIAEDCSASMFGLQSNTPKAGQLWFSPIHETTPQVEVVGPILDQIFDAGTSPQDWMGRRQVKYSIEADAALEELLGGSK